MSKLDEAFKQLQKMNPNDPSVKKAMQHVKLVKSAENKSKEKDKRPTRSIKIPTTSEDK